MEKIEPMKGQPNFTTREIRDLYEKVSELIERVNELAEAVEARKK